MSKKVFKDILTSTSIICSLLMLTACNNNNSSSSITNNTNIITSSEEVVVAKNNNYANPCYPVVGGVEKETYMADPFVIRDDTDGMYYLYCTQTEVFETDTSEFRKFKRGPIYSSINGIDWKYVANAFENY